MSRIDPTPTSIEELIANSHLQSCGITQIKTQDEQVRFDSRKACEAHQDELRTAITALLEAAEQRGYERGLRTPYPTGTITDGGQK